MIIVHELVFSTININMRKLSQLELLEEGFLDTIRTAGTAVKAVGKGIGAVAKGIHALDPEGFNAIAAPLTTLAKPVIGLAKGIAAITPTTIITSAIQWNNLVLGQTVEYQLKQKYYNLFDPNTVYIKDVKDYDVEPRSKKIKYLPKEKTPTAVRKVVTFWAEKYKVEGGKFPPALYKAVMTKNLKGQVQMTLPDITAEELKAVTNPKKPKSENPTTTPVVTPAKRPKNKKRSI